jgi:hypothetical protein
MLKRRQQRLYGSSGLFELLGNVPKFVLTEYGSGYDD